ncbi:hypothetical protein [Streptomyces sp. Act143]|uniref:hypothetical protein n=1 Tax=Streptomyces sp. Act143 TaxID=2200760 RepID=UPI0015E7EEC2
MTTTHRTITNPPAPHDPTPSGSRHAVSASGELAHIGGQYVRLQRHRRPGTGRLRGAVGAAFARAPARTPRQVLGGTEEGWT